jgi:hypothetical protein
MFDPTHLTQCSTIRRYFTDQHRPKPDRVPNELIVTETNNIEVLSQGLWGYNIARNTSAHERLHLNFFITIFSFDSLVKQSTVG